MKQKCIGELHNYLGGVWENIFSFYKMNGGQEGGGGVGLKNQQYRTIQTSQEW